MIEYTVKVTSNTTSWYLNGRYHREDGPAVEGVCGYKAWYINGELHRTDGPALEHADGDKEWFVNGKRHREDGPAFERTASSGEVNHIWFLNGVAVTEAEVMSPTKEMTMAELEAILGHKVKVIN